MMLYMLSASGKDKKTNKQKKKQGAAIMPYILLTFTLFFYMPALFPALLYCILWYILLLKYCILGCPALSQGH